MTTTLLPTYEIGERSLDSPLSRFACVLEKMAHGSDVKLRPADRTLLLIETYRLREEAKILVGYSREAQLNLNSRGYKPK